MSLPHPLCCSITGFAYGHNAMGFRVIYPTTPRLGVTKGSHNNVSPASGHHRPYIRPENRPSAITPSATPYDRRHTSTRVQKWTLDRQSGWYPVPTSASAETAAGFVAGPKRSHLEKPGTRSRAHRTGGGTASLGARGHRVPHRPLPSDRPTVPEPVFPPGTGGPWRGSHLRGAGAAAAPRASPWVRDARFPGPFSRGRGHRSERLREPRPAAAGNGVRTAAGRFPPAVGDRAPRPREPLWRGASGRRPLWSPSVAAPAEGERGCTAEIPRKASMTTVNSGGGSFLG